MGRTAHGGANDDVALAALAALRKRKVRVPQDISVAGFDDTVAASGAGLTSYNFNVAATVREMVRSVLDRSYRRPVAGTEVPGFVVERGSTAAPARQGA